MRIKISNLEKKYYSKKGISHTVFSNLNITIQEPGMYFILGVSGSGKTSLLNMIASFDNDYTGSIDISCKVNSDIRLQKRINKRVIKIGFVFQDNNLITDLSVRENLLFSLKLRNSCISDIKIHETLESLGIEDLFLRMPYELSLGEIQRVAIARALIQDSDIIIADEPTGSLDLENANHVMSILKSISKNKIVIVATHSEQMASFYGNKIIRLAKGQGVINIKENKAIDELVDIDNEYIQYKSNRMKFRNIVGYSIKQTLKKKTRLIFTVILSVIAFTLFGISYVISSYNTSSALLSSLSREDRKYVLISKDTYIFDESSGENQVMNNGISENDLTELSSAFNNEKYIKVFYRYNMYLDNLVDPFLREIYQYSGKQFYTFEINGALEFTSSLMEDLGIELVYGRLPTKNINDNEIMISKYTYDTFYKFDYLCDEEVISINSYDDIIGLSLGDFTIVGIVDTKLNTSRYLLLDDDEFDLSNSIHRNIYFEYSNLCEYSLHTMIFFRENYFVERTTNSEETSVGTLNFYVDVGGNKLKLGDGNTITTDMPNNIFYFDINSSDLRGNEIIIPLNCLSKFGFVGTNTVAIYSEIVESINQKIYALIDNYIVENYNLVKEEFESNHIAENEEFIELFRDYIYNVDINEYQPEYSYSYFEERAINEILTDSIFPFIEYPVSTEYDNFGKLYEYLSFDIVGVYIPEYYDSESDLSNPIIVSQENYQYLTNDIGSLITVLSGDQYYDLDFISSIIGRNEDETQNNQVVFVIDSEYLTMINDADEFITIASTILFVTGIFFAIFASILLFNFISISIKNQKHNIGIIYSLGAHRIDVLLLFLFEGIYIAFACFIISVIDIIVVSELLNIYLQSIYFVTVDFISVQLYHICILFLLILTVSIAASIMPILRFSKHEIKDIIYTQ